MSFAASGRVIKRVDSGECVPDPLCDDGIGQETREMRGGGCGKDLLDFLAAGKVGQDAGTFYRRGTFEVEAGGPGLRGRKIGGGVPSTKIQG